MKGKKPPEREEGKETQGKKGIQKKTIAQH